MQSGQKRRRNAYTGHLRKADIYGVDQRPSYRVKDKNCITIWADTEKVLNKNKQS